VWNEILADAPAAAGVAVSILGLFGLAELIRRTTQAPVELTRKLTHVGAGVIVMSFPWLIDSRWTVAVLAAAFLGLLMLGRVTGQLSSVHGV
jgi:hypothetical protein